jgi:membrane-associated phospholipid phosphatase
MSSGRQAAVARAAGRMWWAPLVPIGLLTDRGFRIRWLGMPIVVILTALASSAGKLAIRRPRPGSAYRLAPWGRLGAAGFPSTHSACAFAIATWLRGSRHSRGLHGAALLVGCARVRCRAHHPGDVVAGAIVGYGVARQLDRAWSRFRAARSPVSPSAPDQVAGPRGKTTSAASRQRIPTRAAEARGQRRRRAGGREHAGRGRAGIAVSGRS